MGATARGLVLAAFAALLVVASGCEVDPYCLDCVQRDGAVMDGPDPSGDGGDPSGDGGRDGGPADACVMSGVEVCDGLDNDCNGTADDNPTDIGGACQETLPLPCTKGTVECRNGTKVCGGGAVVPKAETCNAVDDDCDGEIDDGDPGGGQACGLALGDCQQGVLHCVDDGAGGKVVDCVGDITPQTEACDNRDNDCDGVIDDGNPGGGATCGLGQGICVPGMIKCKGGALQCEGASAPTIEKCDGIDNDCDGSTDEDFNKQTDKNNCGTCGMKCQAANAIMVCQAGQCAIVGCTSGFHDDPMKAGVDCDYACEFNGAEVCNGADDDCDGLTDEAVAAPAGVCATLGECASGVATCGGAAGWSCAYGPTVSKDAMGDIVPENDCDNKDNDCDGDTDEAFPLKGTACVDSGVGDCQGKGTFACNGSKDGLTCPISMPGPGMSAEKCDGKDNDCDGTIDDGAPDTWVPITVAGQNRWIYKFEASRPDATAVAQGTQSARSCSNPNVLPWTNVTFGQAEAACTAAGGALCSEAEWQAACQSSTNNCAWGMDSCSTYGATKCNGNDFDSDSGTAGDQDALRTTQSMSACYANWGSTTNRVFDMSGNVKEWTLSGAGDPANTRRLRGGSYNNTSGGLRCDFRFAVADSTFQFPNVGFRCCRSTPP